MSTIELYDSQGNTLDGGTGEHSQRIEDFFFDGVRLFVDTSNGYEVTLFFRARESEAGRAEQYYAVFASEKSTGLFERFDQALRHEVETNHEMILETSTDDAPFIPLLTAETSMPAVDDKQSSISSMLADGQQLTLGVPDPESAFALVKHYISSPAHRFAIVDSIDDEMMLEYDLTVEHGPYSDVEALGDTTEAFEERLRRTTANALRPRATNEDANGSDELRDRAGEIGKEALAIGLGFVLMAGVVLILLNGAAVIGVGLSGILPVLWVSAASAR